MAIIGIFPTGNSGITPIEKGGTGASTAEDARLNLSINGYTTDTQSVFGTGAAASGDYSTALGYWATASGSSSTALGRIVTASGTDSTALGYWATASGDCSTALGRNATASSDYSTALGYGAKASGKRSTALGYFATASGDYSTALGCGLTASGDCSTALGYGAKASAANSIALGFMATASGTCSAALGYYLTASGYSATALGYQSTASGDYSTALGFVATASGSFSTALGCSSKAYASYSTAVGYGAYVAATSTSGYIQIGNSSYTSIVRVCTSSLTYTSDERDKTDIEPMEDSLEFLARIQPKTYVFNHRTKYDEDEIEELEALEEKAKPAPAFIIDPDTGEEMENPDSGIASISLEDEERLEKLRASKKKREAYGFGDYDREAHARGDKKGDRRRTGVLAQQVQEAMMAQYGTDNYADLVIDNLYDVDEVPEGIESQLGLNYNNFIPFLIDGVNRLYKENLTMKNRLSELEEKIAALTA